MNSKQLINRKLCVMELSCDIHVGLIFYQELEEKGVGMLNAINYCYKALHLGYFRGSD